MSTTTARPKAVAAPRRGVADIALMEIIEDKISWEPALDEIEAELARRFGMSGLEEKASRGPGQ